ncbi:hypothetical protein [Streptomyces sp. N2A]|uniref:hypothetical protein n=1 Tax=Streptomyces sp. N2A TaxID=3073936 RepID=UPI002870391A|nr:hypothetical protein [Streptomyces sp. N2A]
MTQIPVNAARSPFGGRIRLVQQVTEDLEDALAVADYLRRKAEGTLTHLGRTP